ncbi:uncharacterized protein HMPREF1541_00637 [Cyphellophora europaea CBS 101466]|uniref:Uncharacterized protein n=1 Tax=Cyphellophora europaea (strain CBS 101466) TaxID=1220924 RepID=W2SEK9_CYPE1|nr:uncharacterized protein HMPREF1541_00637 [Cyphellophora europaea CBS 101466]ETN46453.1 hypothetical protein HMPREF1541_00637 [Cyphellophora europaea CBS 101466]
MGKNKRRHKLDAAVASKAHSLPPSSSPAKTQSNASAALSTPSRKISNQTALKSPFRIEEPRDFRDSPSFLAQQRAKQRKASETSSRQRFTATVVPDLDTVYKKLNSKLKDVSKEKELEMKTKSEGSTQSVSMSTEAKEHAVTPSAGSQSSQDRNSRGFLGSDLKSGIAKGESSTTKSQKASSSNSVTRYPPKSLERYGKKKKKSKQVPQDDDGDAEMVNATAIEVPATPTKNPDRQKAKVVHADVEENVGLEARESSKKSKKDKKRSHEVGAAKKNSRLEEKGNKHHHNAISEASHGPGEAAEKIITGKKQDARAGWTFHPNSESDEKAAVVPAATEIPAEAENNASSSDEEEPTPKTFKGLLKQRSGKTSADFKSMERVSSSDDESGSATSQSDADAEGEMSEADSTELNKSSGAGSAEDKDKRKKQAVQLRKDPQETESGNESDASEVAKSSSSSLSSSRASSPAEVDEPTPPSENGSEASSDHENDADTESSAASDVNDDSGNDSDDEEEPEQPKPAPNPLKRKRQDSTGIPPSSVTSRNPVPSLWEFPSVRDVIAESKQRLDKALAEIAASAAAADPQPAVTEPSNSAKDKTVKPSMRYTEELLKQAKALEEILPDDYLYKGDETVAPTMRLMALLHNAKVMMLRLAGERVTDNGGPSAAMQRELLRIARAKDNEIKTLRGQVWEMIDDHRKSTKTR